VTVSELLRIEECIREIDKQPQANDPADDVFPVHGSPHSSEPIAGTNIPEGYSKKDQNQHDKKEIKHFQSPANYWKLD
jgi:hypothetical protein